MPNSLKTSDFDFALPPACIAQKAIEPRDHARLLHVLSHKTADYHVYDLPDLLRSGDLLVINNTRVIPARLYGARGAMKVEVLLHKKERPSHWWAFARPGKRLHIGDTIVFGPDLAADLIDKHPGGEVLLRFSVADHDVMPLLHIYGEPPLPPYIKRDKGKAREESGRYQTVYAEHDGAVAAPTAGLHFTPDLLTKLTKRGIEHVTVTLHVGAGTFLPVKAEHIKDHIMHAEWGHISASVAETINQARRAGRRIVAVGTTSLRVLESAADPEGVVHPFSQDTSIFITPGYSFRVTNVLLTNFHLPQSTLFMLVSAFMGLERMREAYAYAIQNNYRFYSYGDASLLER